ncbi:MAG TPA: hypothetical protein VG734_25995 [Lacunisphaera sp.]|nr:hypothetical protein [Lacunisphaera sp.]
MQFAVAALASANGIKTSIASATSIQTYSGGALNGAMLAPLLGGFQRLGSFPSVTTSAQASAYTLNSTVTFTGPWRGQTVTRTATITNTGNAATYVADGPLDGAPTSITVAAQAATNGAFTFGWSGITPACTTGRFREWSVVCTSAGNLHCECGSDNPDTVPLIAGQQYLASPTRIYPDSTGAYTIYEAA